MMVNNALSWFNKGNTNTEFHCIFQRSLSALVSNAAVIKVVTQRFSPLSWWREVLRDDLKKLSGGKRCVRTAVQETISALLPALSEGLSPGFHYEINQERMKDKYSPSILTGT